MRKLFFALFSGYLVVALLFAAPDAAAADLYLKDGDSFVLNGKEIRLYGIDAPELHQTCRRDGLEYACGREAKAFLKSLTAAGEMSCEEQPKAPREERIVALCTIGGQDIGQLMVRNGWAVDYAYFSKGKYEADQEIAQKAGRGIWAGTFDQPRDWRRSHPRH